MKIYPHELLYRLSFWKSHPNWDALLDINQEYETIFFIILWLLSQPFWNMLLALKKNENKKTNNYLTI